MGSGPLLFSPLPKTSLKPGRHRYIYIFSPLSHTVLLMLGVRGQPCGTQGPAFVRRPSTRAHHTDTTTTATPQQHHTTFLVWCHITRKVVLHGCGVVVVCLWCRCGVPGLCTKVRPCVPLYQPHLTPASYAGNYSLVAPQDAMDDCHFCLRCFKWDIHSSLMWN